MDILRITALWSGFPGAPGYSVFHFTTDGGFWDGGVAGDPAQGAAQGAAERVSTAFSNLVGFLPNGADIQIEPEAVVLNSDTGEAVGFIDVDAPPTEPSASSNDMVGPAGAVVNWRTSDYRFGRRIRGRTFLVPLNIRAYESDGTLSDIGRDAVQLFGDAMVNGEGSADFGVWSRPRGGSGGVFATVDSFNVPDMAAVLRSRRD